MSTRLFHTIVVCGAALGAAALGCGDDGEDPKGDRCVLPDGSCDEHCTAAADGGCIDPCFVHTETCAAECVQTDGSCGWPPTK